MSTISFTDFYGEYHGHKVEHLEKLLPNLRSSSDALIWTCGDSSLDNKYWFQDRQRAIGVYQSVLNPPTSICDVTYWLNFLAEERRKNEGYHGETIAAINTAVEATTLNERWYRPRAQDKFLRDNISSNDILIVSVGGNDIALAPTPCTIASIAGLMCLPMPCLEQSRSYCSIPVDDYCFGCGPSLCSCAGSCPPCFGYFVHLFGTRVEKYIQTLTSKTKPKKILVCMIYYPDETRTDSWAGGALRVLGYNSDPGKLQTLIKKLFEEATSKIKIQGSEVIPVPLFNVLNGKNTQDYAYRVEPSAQGGRKMAEYLLDIIENPAVVRERMVSAPSSSLIPSTSRI